MIKYLYIYRERESIKEVYHNNIIKRKVYKVEHIFICQRGEKMLTSVQISEEDFKFVKENHLKFSELMREAIFQKKQVRDGCFTDNLKAERDKSARFEKIADELRERLWKLQDELEQMQKRGQQRLGEINGKEKA